MKAEIQNKLIQLKEQNSLLEQQIKELKIELVKPEQWGHKVVTCDHIFEILDYVQSSIVDLNDMLTVHVKCTNCGIQKRGVRLTNKLNSGEVEL
jgi:hypothetical protein